MTPAEVQAACAVVSALASLASLAVAALAVWFSKKSGERLRDQEERFADCLQALVIAQLVGNKSATSDAILAFKDRYKGKTQIFP